MNLAADFFADRSIASILTDPRTCALYLSDALESGRVGEVSEALRDIGRASGAKVCTLRGEVGLAELMSILDAAGIILVAVPKD